MKSASSVCLVVGILLPVRSLSAQSTTPVFWTASSTGMMGLAAAQTVQINVVNLSTTTMSTTPVAPCEVQLEFWDATGKMIKSTTISNLAPGTAGQFQIKLTDVTTSTSTLRTEVRGVVRTNPLPTAGSGTATPIAYPFSCSVATTLEVFDNGTGVTQSLTSDLHALTGGVAVPLLHTTLSPVPLP